MKLVGDATIAAFDPFQTDTSFEQMSLGEMINLGDGRCFKYAKAGAVATSAGKLELAPAPKTNHHNLAVTATAAGATVVNVTLGATAAVADEYDEGFMAVNAGPGIGQVYRISQNPAIVLSVAGNITLADPISTAFTTSTKVTLVHNQLNGFVEAASATRRVAGVGLVGAAIGAYTWLQSEGVAAVLADGAVALGSLVVASGSVAGAVTIGSGTFATFLATTVVGQASILALVDTEYRPVMLGLTQ